MPHVSISLGPIQLNGLKQNVYVKSKWDAHQDEYGQQKRQNTPNSIEVYPYLFVVFEIRIEDSTKIKSNSTIYLGYCS